MEDELKKIKKNGRRPQKKIKIKTTSIIFLNERRPQKKLKMEDDLIFVVVEKLE